MYIKINGKTKHYAVTVEPFTTQHGKKAIRFVGGNVPDTDKGFKYYNDDGTEVLDLSAYVYLYRANEYTMEEDAIVLPSGNTKPLPPNPIDVRFSNVYARINSITPYEQSKTVGIQDTECIFTGVPKNGTILANVKKQTGEYIPCTIERADSRVKVLFDTLNTVATVTIQIK